MPSLSDTVSQVHDANINETDRNTTEASAALLLAWGHAADGITVWDATVALGLAGLVVSHTIESVGARRREAARHSLSELRAISEAAERAAGGASLPPVPRSAITTTATGMIGRLYPVVSAAPAPGPAIRANGYQATRILETESFAHYNNVRAAHGLKVAANPDVTGIVWRWNAALDRRTCPTCRGLHNRQFPLAEPPPPPPVHALCRCVLGTWPV